MMKTLRKARGFESKKEVEDYLLADEYIDEPDAVMDGIALLC